jgi:hypothetical protein
MDLHRMTQALEALGDVLEDRGLTYHVAVGGGAALLLAGHIRRPTQDVDVVAFSTGSGPLRSEPTLPRELVEAVQDVARVLDLDDDWLNAGAVAIVADRLPDRFEQRMGTHSYGSLTVSVLGREDLIRLKLFAAADEGPGSTHHLDLVRLAPTAVELRDAISWIHSQERKPSDAELDDVISHLRRIHDA